MVYSPDRENRDQSAMEPLNAYAIPENSCYQAQSAVETSSSEQKTKELEVAASVEVGYSGVVEASFKLSAGYKSFEQEVIEKKSRSFTMTSYCLLYKLGFHELGVELPVEDDFCANAKSLPKITSKESITAEQRKYSILLLGKPFFLIYIYLYFRQSLALLLC